MKTDQKFTITFVSRHTGLKPHVIRAWESRYAAVVPNRTPTNRRLYCQQDLQRLCLLKKATEAGHPISSVARATIDELKTLLDVSLPPAALPEEPRPQTGRSAATAQQYRDICLETVIELDPDRLNSALSEAAVHLTRQSWVEDVVKPLFLRIGELWSSGPLKVLNEHVASNCVRTIMGDMLRSVEIASNAPSIVVGTPVGQWHELGALSAALAAADAGWRPIYVGVNLPAEELAAALNQFDSKCIGISLSHRLDDHRLQSELTSLRRYIGPERHILIGGYNDGDWDDLVTRIGARRIVGWQNLSDTLKSLSANGI